MSNEFQAWEYRVQKFGSIWTGTREAELEKILNEWGQEGWEVVSSAGLESGNKITVIAKRPLSDRVRRSRSMPA
ncbi:MAG TPA: DUF4177 domain-containing protein [Anaerolineales bacterium]|jgi:hypothetical protein